LFSVRLFAARLNSMTRRRAAGLLPAQGLWHQVVQC
jgi:hypothetical protein